MTRNLKSFKLRHSYVFKELSHLFNITRLNYNEKASGILFKSITIAINIITIVAACLLLLIYRPIAIRILNFIINSYDHEVPEVPDPGLFLFQHLFGIIGFCLVIFIPPGLIIFFAWRLIKKITLHRREIYQSMNHPRSSLIANDIYEKARHLYMSGNYQNAINVYTNLINLSKNADKAYFYRAYIHYKLGNKKQALYDFKDAARLGHQRSQKLLGSRGITWETISIST